MPQLPTGPREFKIKDRSKRNFATELDHQTAIVREEKPGLDAHTLEREARNRERMLKEQQRRQGLGSGRKRSADEGVAVNGDGEEGGHRSSRRKVKDEGGEGRRSGRKGRGSWQYEDEESGEARATRVEKEREAARWN